MRVIPVPCLSDNYAYLVTAEGSTDAVVIDPSEAAPVIEAVRREGLSLVGVINTHHHWDHIGGNEGLREAFGELPVYAHASDTSRVPTQTVKVEEGTAFDVAGLRFEPLHVPGHTTGAVAYVVEGAVFTGDTLFVAGCGRMFEGTPPMMHGSLSKLAALPPETRVYCGHEYTVANLKFAQAVEPENTAVSDKLAASLAARARNEPTVPSTIASERLTNPFLRCAESSVRAGAARVGQPIADGASDADVFGAVRRAKDGFKA